MNTSWNINKVVWKMISLAKLKETDYIGLVLLKVDRCLDSTQLMSTNLVQLKSKSSQVFLFYRFWIIFYRLRKNTLCLRMSLNIILSEIQMFESVIECDCEPKRKISKTFLSLQQGPSQDSAKALPPPMSPIVDSIVRVRQRTLVCVLCSGMCSSCVSSGICPTASRARWWWAAWSSRATFSSSSSRTRRSSRWRSSTSTCWPSTISPTACPACRAPSRVNYDVFVWISPDIWL